MQPCMRALFVCAIVQPVPRGIPIVGGALRRRRQSQQQLEGARARNRARPQEGPKQLPSPFFKIIPSHPALMNVCIDLLKAKLLDPRPKPT